MVSSEAAEMPKRSTHAALAKADCTRWLTGLKRMRSVGTRDEAMLVRTKLRERRGKRGGRIARAAAMGRAARRLNAPLHVDGDR